ncbi:MAG: DJ-1/PfpI family protein [Clostridia bacterium]|nr:DJ-1/PfpI family protein [Clostridia bacterium]
MVYLFLANGFEEIEALCPLDLLRRAGAEVRTVAITAEGRAVTGAHGITVMADLAADEFPPDADAEMLILPGGMPGAANLNASPVVDAAIARAVQNGAYLAAICAAPMILGRRGLLAGCEATCFPGFEDELKGAMLTTARVVRDGKIITAAGMGVALEFGLALVAELYGEDRADALRTAVLAD